MTGVDLQILLPEILLAVYALGLGMPFLLAARAWPMACNAWRTCGIRRSPSADSRRLRVLRIVSHTLLEELINPRNMAFVDIF